jgi:hypothetical protein
LKPSFSLRLAHPACAKKTAAPTVIAMARKNLFASGLRRGEAAEGIGTRDCIRLLDQDLSHSVVPECTPPAGGFKMAQSPPSIETVIYVY